MSYQVKFRTGVEFEIQEIADFIAQDNPYKSLEFTASLRKYFKETLARFPEMGVVHKGSIRKLTYRRYTAFYLVDEDNQIIDILHIVNLTKPLEERGIKL